MIATDEEIVVIASDDHQHEVIVTNETQIVNEVENEDTEFLTIKSDHLSPLNLVTTSADIVHQEQDTFVYGDAVCSAEQGIVDPETLTLKRKYQDTLIFQDTLFDPGTKASLDPQYPGVISF